MELLRLLLGTITLVPDGRPAFATVTRNGLLISQSRVGALALPLLEVSLLHLLLALALLQVHPLAWR